MNQNLAVSDDVQERLYTYKDYASWDTVEKYELFNGEAVMQASPSASHQIIQNELQYQLTHFLKGKKCRILPNFDVLFPAFDNQRTGDVSNVLVPDIIVVCEPEKIKEQYCLGAPTVVMEILSQSTAKNDRLRKLNIYQSAGVPEYWIVSPQEGTASVFLLKNGLYHAEALYTREDTEAKVFSLEGCTLDLSGIFEQV